MSTEQASKRPDAPDASDVITGDIGEARLRDPASSGPEGAELEQLPIVPADDVDVSAIPVPRGAAE
jgi:hypothetical protein